MGKWEWYRRTSESARESELERRERNKKKFIQEAGISSYVHLIKSSNARNFGDVALYEGRLQAALSLLVKNFPDRERSHEVNTASVSSDEREMLLADFSLFEKDRYLAIMVNKAYKRRKVTADEIENAIRVRQEVDTTSKSMIKAIEANLIIAAQDYANIQEMRRLNSPTVRKIEKKKPI